MYALILAGGSGTRFWPLSRPERPKQLIRLFGNGPMIRETVDRLEGLIPKSHIRIICGEKLGKVTMEASGIPPQGGIFEPMARNTCAAIALGAVSVLKEAGDEVVVVMPSDHFVRDTKGFQSLLSQAAELANQGHIVTLGIEPTRPETGFGYIRSGNDFGTYRKVDAFVEKPNLETALEYLNDDRFLWNAGIFIFRPSTLLAELKRQKPAIFEAFVRIQNALRTPEEATVIRSEFESMESISIDYAVMENAQSLLVLPANVGWSDVGHWAAIPEVRDADQNNNVIDARAILIDTKDTIVVSEDHRRTIALLGLEGLVVVDTPDALLILPRDRAQDVRLVVEALAKE